MVVTSFTVRTTALLALMVTLTTGLVLATGGWLLHRQTMSGLDALNAAEFSEVEDRLGHFTTLTAAEIQTRLRPHTETDAALFFFQVRGANGELLFRSANLGQVVMPVSIRPPSSREETLPGFGRVRISEFPYGQLLVQIAASSEAAERLVRVYARTSALLLGGVALASVGLGWSFARFVLRPVRAIRETASRIGGGDNLGERIPVPNGSDELAALAKMLNEMLARLEASFQEVKRFTADASHELKTPLALMRLNAEKLRTRVGADTEASEAVGDLLEDLDRLRGMIDRLLFLAKADSGSFTPPSAEIATGDFVRALAEDGEALAHDVGRRFVLGACDEGFVRGDATLLRQLVLNLFSNACRAATGGEVRFDGRLEDDTWRLTVTDNGPGLPPEQLARMFERFVRFTPPGAEAQAAGGHGLGLAICQSIARLHDGRIRAENRTDGSGLRVIVELPLGPRASE
jgi:signal transduction histidine kinase